MLTARIHLDDVTADNGPLRVMPGSHRHYAMGEDEPREPVAITCRAGDVLLTRPLLTAASGLYQAAKSALGLGSPGPVDTWGKDETLTRSLHPVGDFLYE